MHDVATTLVTPLETMPPSAVEAWEGRRLIACPACGSRLRNLGETRGCIRDHCLRCGAEHARTLATETDMAVAPHVERAPGADGPGPMRWVAHAGLAVDRPGGAPTRETLAEVLRAGVDCVELDVCVTHDEALVLRHDPRLRTGRRLVTLTLAELRRRGHSVLTLDDAAEMMAGRVPVLIDVKSRGVTGPLTRWLRRRRQLDVLGICSDDRDVLAELREGAPRVPRWWSLPAIPASSPQWAGAVVDVLVQRRGLRGLALPLADLRALARDRPWGRSDLLHLAAIPARRGLPAQLPRLTDEVAAAGLAVAHGAVTPALCAAAQRLGLVLAAWTVNRVGLARQLRRCGVQIIISDRVVPLRLALAAAPG
jgi:glycerophosphoryl diester phosphodiesterase